ncbi:MAG: GntR family transcriptional regulator [Bacteroidales bacterium]
MIFNNTQPIFIQIADYVSELILRKELQSDQQIPSVRELAVKLEVNPNTVMRAFERLQQNEVVYNKRGLGYFVSQDAYEKILAQRKLKLFEDVLPAIYEEMALLDITDTEFLAHLKAYKKSMK